MRKRRWHLLLALALILRLVQTASASGPYPITVRASSHGTVSVDKQVAEKGEQVTLTIIPEENYTLDLLTLTDRYGTQLHADGMGGGVYVFTMPGSAVTIQTRFIRQTAHQKSVYRHYHRT